MEDLRILLHQLCTDFLMSLRYSGNAEAFSANLLDSFLSADSFLSSEGDAAKEKLREILIALKSKQKTKIVVPSDCVGSLNVLVNMAKSSNANYKDLYELDCFEIHDAKYSVFISHEDVDDDGSGCSSVTIRKKG